MVNQSLRWHVLSVAHRCKPNTAKNRLNPWQVTICTIDFKIILFSFRTELHPPPPSGLEQRERTAWTPSLKHIICFFRRTCQTDVSTQSSVSPDCIKRKYFQFLWQTWDFRAVQKWRQTEEGKKKKGASKEHLPPPTRVMGQNCSSCNKTISSDVKRHFSLFPLKSLVICTREADEGKSPSYVFSSSFSQTTFKNPVSRFHLIKRLFNLKTLEERRLWRTSPAYKYRCDTPHAPKGEDRTWRTPASPHKSRRLTRGGSLAGWWSACERQKEWIFRECAKGAKGSNWTQQPSKDLWPLWRGHGALHKHS